MDRQIRFIIDKGISMADEICGPEVGLRMRLLRPQIKRSFKKGGGFCWRVTDDYRVEDAYLYAIMITRTMVRFIFRDSPTSEELTSFEKEFLVNDEEDAATELGLER